MIRKKNYAKSSSSGFTVLEITVVMTLAAILIGAAIPLAKSWIQRGTVAANKQRMSAIQQALDNYVTQHGRLPCPSSFLKSDANFGHEYTPYCTTPARPIPGAGIFSSANGRTGNINPSANGNTTTPTPDTIIMGALPVRDLGLPDSLIADSYGYMYTYAVPQYEATLATYSSTGGIDIKDTGFNTVLPAAPGAAAGGGTATYVVVDHGSDGKGAYTIAGVPSPIICGSNPGLDNTNCNHYALGYFLTSQFSNAPGGSWFDDMIVYNSPTTNITPSTSAPACTVFGPTTNLPAAAMVGSASGHYEYAVDIGGGTGFDPFGFGIFWFGDIFVINIASGPSTYISQSPTADAYCPDNTYNAVTGGCTQTGTAPTYDASGNVTNTFGAGTYVGAVIIPPVSYYQFVPPPMSHPAAPVAGAPGWECNGSSAAGMQVQAYVVCCPSKG